MNQNDDYLRRFFQANDMFSSNEEGNSIQGDEKKDTVEVADNVIDEHLHLENDPRVSRKQINLKQLFSDIEYEKNLSTKQYEQQKQKLTEEIFYSYSLPYTQHVLRQKLESFLTAYRAFETREDVKENENIPSTSDQSLQEREEIRYNKRSNTSNIQSFITPFGRNKLKIAEVKDEVKDKELEIKNHNEEDSIVKIQENIQLEENTHEEIKSDDNSKIKSGEDSREFLSFEEIEELYKSFENQAVISNQEVKIDSFPQSIQKDEYIQELREIQAIKGVETNEEIPEDVKPSVSLNVSKSFITPFGESKLEIKNHNIKKIESELKIENLEEELEESHEESHDIVVQKETKIDEAIAKVTEIKEEITREDLEIKEEINIIPNASSHEKETDVILEIQGVEVNTQKEEVQIDTQKEEAVLSHSKIFRTSRISKSKEYILDIWEKTPERIPDFQENIQNQERSPFSVSSSEKVLKTLVEKESRNPLEFTKTFSKYSNNVSKYIADNFSQQKNTQRFEYINSLCQIGKEYLLNASEKFVNAFEIGSKKSQYIRRENAQKISESTSVFLQTIKNHLDEYSQSRAKKKIEQQKKREEALKIERIKDEKFREEQNIKKQREEVKRIREREAKEEVYQAQKAQARKIEEQKRKEEIEVKRLEEIKKQREDALAKEKEQQEIAQRKKHEAHIAITKTSAAKPKEDTPEFTDLLNQFFASPKTPAQVQPKKNSYFKEIKEWGKVAGMVAIVGFVGLLALGIPGGYIQQYESWWNADMFEARQASIENLIEQKPSPFQKIQTLPVAGEEESFVTQEFLNIAPPDTRIVIPKIARNIPIIQTGDDARLSEDWEQLEAEIQDALRDGVVHYPGTAMPGQNGNVFITGHSSYYPWDEGRYKDVFAALHNLEVGDEYFIFHQGRKYGYRITERKVVPPSDVSVLDQDPSKKESTLMTCTPIGTAKNRLILKAEEISVGY